MRPPLERLGYLARQATTRAILAQLRFELRVRGGDLIADVHPLAYVAGRIRVLQTNGEHPPVLRLTMGPYATVAAGLGFDMARENTLTLGAHAWLYPNVHLRMIGGRIELSEHAVVGSGCSLDVDGQFTMGTRARLGVANQVHSFRSVTLGDMATTAHDCTLVDTDHAFDGSDRWFVEQPCADAPVSVGSNTVVSAGSRILRGAAVGRNSMVGANAVVLAGEYPDGVLLAGAPAKVRRSLAERPIGSRAVAEAGAS